MSNFQSALNTPPAQASQPANVHSSKHQIISLSSYKNRLQNLTQLRDNHRTRFASMLPIQKIQRGQLYTFNPRRSLDPKSAQPTQPFQAGQPTNFNNNEQNTRPAQSIPYPRHVVGPILSQLTQLAQSIPYPRHVLGPELSQLTQPSQAGQPANLNSNEQNTQPAQSNQLANITKAKINCELCTKDVETRLADHMVLNHPGLSKKCFSNLERLFLEGLTKE